MGGEFRGGILRGGIILGGSYPGGNLPGGNFPGGEIITKPYENYELATGIKDKNQDQRVAVLLSIIGYDAL